MGSQNGRHRNNPNSQVHDQQTPDEAADDRRCPPSWQSHRRQKRHQRKTRTNVQGYRRLHRVLWFSYRLWWRQDNWICTHLRFVGLLEAVRTQVQVSQTGFVQEGEAATKAEEGEEEQDQEGQGYCQSKDRYWQEMKISRR